MSEHQFFSNPHFSGNALGSQSAKVFRGLFILMLLASLVGWQASPANAADLDPAVVCYKLTIDQTGMGLKPIAAPTKSVDCADGEYVAGATITLSGAVPSGGYQIGGWRGTTNNASLASTNTVTMPASDVATAGVDYVEVFYFTFHVDVFPIQVSPLPAAGAVDPSGDTQYAKGESFSVTALPAAGWVFVGWGGDLTGTTNPTSTTMTKEILAQAYFTQTGSVCYTLILNHTGNGLNPTTFEPIKSSACPSEHQYMPGEVITLSGATPGSGYEITGWRGTSNNTSHSGTNTLTMPSSHTFAWVDYALINATYLYMPSIRK